MKFSGAALRASFAGGSFAGNTRIKPSYSHSHSCMIPPNEASDDEISFKDLMSAISRAARSLWQSRLRVVPYVVAFGAVGLVIAVGSPEEYSASMRLLPYRSTGGAAGLSGIAGLAGIRLPTGSGDQIITSDLYPEVVSSLDFRLTVAESPIAFGSLGRKVSFVEYFRNAYRPSFIELLSAYTVHLPAKVASLSSRLLSAPSVGDTTSTFVEGQAIRSFDREYLELVQGLNGRLTTWVDRKTNVVTISATMPDAYAAADLVRVASEKLMETVIAFDSRKAAEQFNFVNEQHLRALRAYHDAQRNLAAFDDRNRVLSVAVAQLERDRLQRESNLAFEIFQQLSRDLEQARIKMNLDTPVFAVLQGVSVPAVRSSPKSTRIVLFSLFTGLCVGVVRVASGGAAARKQKESSS